jgi:hypothetical protein
VIQLAGEGERADAVVELLSLDGERRAHELMCEEAATRKNPTGGEDSFSSISGSQDSKGGPKMSTIAIEIEQPPESPTAPPVPVEEPEPTPDPVTEPEPDPVENPAPPPTDLPEPEPPNEQEDPTRG